MLIWGRTDVGREDFRSRRIRPLANRIIQTDRKHGTGVHARSIEEDIAQAVVAHLTACHVPGLGHNDKEPERGEKRSVGREGERREDRCREEYDVQNCVF